LPITTPAIPEVRLAALNEALNSTPESGAEHPQSGAVHRGMIIALLWLNRINKAREALRRRRKVSPE
jgi:hypothetical protein